MNSTIYLNAEQFAKVTEDNVLDAIKSFGLRATCVDERVFFSMDINDTEYLCQIAFGENGIDVSARVCALEKINSEDSSFAWNLLLLNDDISPFSFSVSDLNENGEIDDDDILMLITRINYESTVKELRSNIDLLRQALLIADAVV